MIVGIIWNPGRPDSDLVLLELFKTCRQQGVDHVLCSPESAIAGIEAVSEQKLAKESDLVISVGGDGTLLGAARLLAGTKIPLWSIHTGTLGFLTEALPEEISESLPRVLNGQCDIKEIELISATVTEKDSEKFRALAFNEVTVEAGGTGPMISLSVEVDGKFVTTIDGNGIIVSTPSGSTAYNLAAGGPIVLQGLPVLVINPICPHALSHRPIIVSNRSEIVLRPLSSAGNPHLVADGQAYMEDLGAHSRIQIGGSGQTVRIVKTSQRSQFDILREKLGWGDPRRKYNSVSN